MTVTTEPVSTAATTIPAPSPRPKAPVRMIIGWAAVIAALAAATVLAVSVLTPDRTAPTSDVVPAVVDGPPGVPGTADAAQRWLADATASGGAQAQGLPRSADAAEHWLAEREQRVSAAYTARLQGQADAYLTGQSR